MRNVYVITLMTFMMSCASEQWVHPQFGTQLANQHEAECELEATQMYNAGQQNTINVNTNSNDQTSSGSRAAQIGNAAGQGLGEGIARGFEIGRLTILCMEARGYSRRPVE